MFPVTYVRVVVHCGNQVLDQSLKRCRHQAIVMVTHLPVAGGDAVSVKPRFRRSYVVVVTTGLVAAAAAAAARVAMCAAWTGSAVLARAVRLRRGVWVFRQSAAGVMMLLRIHRGDRGAPISPAVRLRYVVGILSNRVGAVVDVLPRRFRDSAAPVRARRLLVVGIAAVRDAGAELPSIWRCWRHDDLYKTYKE